MWDNDAVRHLAAFDYHRPAERWLPWRVMAMGENEIE